MGDKVGKVQTPTRGVTSIKEATVTGLGPKPNSDDINTFPEIQATGDLEIPRSKESLATKTGPCLDLLLWLLEECVGQTEDPWCA